MRNWSDEVKEAVSKLSTEEREEILSNRKSFMMYTDKFSAIKKLSFDQIGKLFTNIMEYQSGEPITDFSDPLIEILFDVLQHGFVDDVENYIHMTVKNRINWKKFKKRTTGTPLGSDKDKENENENDTENETVTDKVNGNDKGINNNINNNNLPASASLDGDGASDWESLEGDIV